MFSNLKVRKFIGRFWFVAVCVASAPAHALPTLRICIARGLGISVDARSLEQILDEQKREVSSVVVIQQEHEGSLNPNPRDSSGNFLTYYRPSGEIQPGLVEQVTGALGPVARAFYRTRLALNKGDAWAAFTDDQKLKYLVLLEKSAGEDAAWGGRQGQTFLLMQRSPNAPEWVASHPSFERQHFQASGRSSSYGAFSFPEITTAEDRPAYSIDAAITRARQIIRDTGHPSMHFHLFFDLPVERAADSSDAVVRLLTSLNELYFAQALVRDRANLVSPYLQSWTEGRSAQVRELLAHPPDGPVFGPEDDDQNQKFANLAFRYWGIRDGKIRISFEVRGGAAQFKRPVLNGLDPASASPSRDFGPLERTIATVRLFPKPLASGNLPRDALPRLHEAPASVATADSVLASFADSGDVPKLETVATKLYGRVFPGLLAPFAEAGAGKLDAPLQKFLTGYLAIARQIDSASPATLENERRTFQFEFSGLYKAWANARTALYVSRVDEAIRASVAALATRP